MRLLPVRKAGECINAAVLEEMKLSLNSIKEINRDINLIFIVILKITI